MRWFQGTVLLLLATIAIELGIIAMRLPVVPAFAQGRGPVPVVINDGFLSEGCVTIILCARVQNGALRVDVR